MFFSNHSISQISQDSIKKDTVYVNDDSFEEQAIYGARDSMYIDLKENKIHLYGEAHLEYMETNMKAGYILVDLKKNEVFATYIYDKDSNKIEMPIFKNDAEEIQASRIRYNFDTQKGYIEEVKIKQDEIYLYMGVAKRQKNGDIHFRQGRFTTCELDDPHYHFNLSKAVMIPDERIVTGPMNLWVKGIPTPFGLPFSVIPQQKKKRTHGFLFPQLIPSSNYGFGVADLGYFIPLNDKIQTSSFVTLYNRGSWGARNQTDYFTQYKNSGSFAIGFQQLFQGFPSTDKAGKLSLNWDHAMDTKSNPYWNFSSKINFISDNNSKNNLNLQNNQNSQFLSNQLRSDINLKRVFPGKPLTVGMKINLIQNTTSKNISLNSPEINADLARISPFKNLFQGNKNWTKPFTAITFGYSFKGKNASTFSDSLMKNRDFVGIQNKFINGINQVATIQTTIGLFNNSLKINPSVNYTNNINFQQINKTFDAINDSLITSLQQKVGYSQTLNFNASLTTVVYSYYKFIGKRQPLLRHVLTPSVGFSYVPNLNTIQTLDTGIVNIKTISYSHFENSMFPSVATKNAALINFSFNNTFELKRKSEKDTITGFKKTNIINGLSFNGNYDLLKDSMQLSNIGINLSVNPTKTINFVASSSFSPYEWNSSGASTGTYALSSKGKIGRIISSNLSTTFTFTSKESKDKLKDAAKTVGSDWNTDYNYFALYPERVINFDIPWKINFTHVYSINANTNRTPNNPENYTKIQTLSSNGDLSFTKRWKIAGTVNFDIKTLKIGYTTLALTRNMHCWNLSFNWIPIGTAQSFVFSLRSTSSMFKDLKLDLRNPPSFL